MASTSLFIFTEEMIIQKKGKTKASPSTTISRYRTTRAMFAELR